jgi:hypothetical protein
MSHSRFLAVVALCIFGSVQAHADYPACESGWKTCLKFESDGHLGDRSFKAFAYYPDSASIESGNPIFLSQPTRPFDVELVQGTNRVVAISDGKVLMEMGTVNSPISESDDWYVAREFSLSPQVALSYATGLPYDDSFDSGFNIRLYECLRARFAIFTEESGNTIQFKTGADLVRGPSTSRDRGSCRK